MLRAVPGTSISELATVVIAVTMVTMITVIIMSFQEPVQSNSGQELGFYFLSSAEMTSFSPYSQKSISHLLSYLPQLLPEV